MNQRMSSHRIVFLATGDIALPSLSALLGKNLVALVTQPDKPVGRKQILTSPRIKDEAIAHGIPVIQPESAKDPLFLEKLRALEPDVIVVMAYGQILSKAFLEIPRVACINLHASLLPRYRGAACIQAAIDAGDSHTGITVMHVVKALDAGDIILKLETPIGAEETGGELHDRLADMAPEALTEALKQIADGTAGRTPQDPTEVSYISKLMREDGEIDWSQSAESLERRVRAYDPWPGTSTFYTERKGRKQGSHRRLKIFPPVRVSDEILPIGTEPGQVLVCGELLQVACGEGSLIISHLQPEGSRRMTAAEFLMSEPVVPRGRLGASSKTN